MQIKNPIRPIVILDGSSKTFTFKVKIRLMNKRYGTNTWYCIFIEQKLPKNICRYTLIVRVLCSVTDNHVVQPMGNFGTPLIVGVRHYLNRTSKCIQKTHYGGGGP